MKFATIPCCCGGVECYVCHTGTAPPAFQVTPSGVTSGFSPACCNDCGAFNQPFSLPFQGTGPFDGAQACYWLLNVGACNPAGADYLRVVLVQSYGPGHTAWLIVQAFGATPACPFAPQPLFDERHDFGLASIDCSEIDLTFTYTRPPILGDTAVCNWKSASVRVLALP